MGGLVILEVLLGEDLSRDGTGSSPVLLCKPALILSSIYQDQVNVMNTLRKLSHDLDSKVATADPKTDEVHAQMTLQPVPSFDKEALLRSNLSMKANKPQPEFFCKTLTVYEERDEENDEDIDHT
ncbi:hypothetical protein BC332_21219 [Capsicum chinense]|nr:hypothetical protein BC332_21219 [Capsicum chinense]